MINLLKETKNEIEGSGHKITDIIFIGSEFSGHQCTWGEFKELANKEYDDGYGTNEVVSDLIIAFKDGAKMWRGEYDGSEWWEYSSPFEMTTKKKKIKNIFSLGYERSLEELNKEK